jgi:hypothetical protein
MDEAHVLARLDRIDELKHELKHSGAAPVELLVQLQAELRGLLREAEALTRECDDAKGRTEEVVGRVRTALARDIIGM